MPLRVPQAAALSFRSNGSWGTWRRVRPRRLCAESGRLKVGPGRLPAAEMKGQRHRSHPGLRLGASGAALSNLGPAKRAETGKLRPTGRRRRLVPSPTFLGRAHFTDAGQADARKLRHPTRVLPALGSPAAPERTGGGKARRAPGGQDEVSRPDGGLGTAPLSRGVSAAAGWSLGLGLVGDPAPSEPWRREQKTLSSASEPRSPSAALGPALAGRKRARCGV